MWINMLLVLAKINWVCCKLDWRSLKTGSKDPATARKTKILSSVPLRISMKIIPQKENILDII